MRLHFVGAIIAFISFTSLMTTAYGAGSQFADMERMIKAKNSKIETLLNDRTHKAEAARFLHNHISEDATFTLSVYNPVLPSKEQSFEMSKTDYINTYIQGTNFVQNYNVNIDTVKFEPSKGDPNKTYSTEIMTERGTAMDPRTAKKGRDFVSRTVCRTLNSLQDDGTVISEGSQCHTEISFEESA